ncbi:MAG: orotate phosphoribosyltransferase [Alphaproteobacteria bacterium]|nr:orotate phosphoribosyltransferase [Alphaproteobacteria bacterium]MCB9985357.1 orotate phosphoribosyltransferase [Micavibrio sp.]HPQ51287.1 orotate phosphoribosyltransferase [Alphaproteobacteria bacterium]
MTDQNTKIAAKILLDTKSVLFNAREPFVFTSGRISPVYVDIRRLISFPTERTALMDMGAELLKEKVGINNIDYVAGGETAGIPYAAFLSDRLNKPMLYVRKKPKGFGRMAQIEGCMDKENANVILIEDLQTDGGSKKVFIDAIRAAGAKIAHSFVVFHYGIFPQSLENMKAAGVELYNLTDWWSVLAVARENKYFDEETLASVESFLNEPDQWAQNNAHLVKKQEQA